MTYFAHLLLLYLIFNSTNEARSLILQNEFFYSPYWTGSTAHQVPPVVGQGISKPDTAIQLKSYGSTTVPPPSDVPMAKGNDTSPSCDVAGKNNVPTEHDQVSTNTHGQDKAPSENKHSATDPR